MDERPGVQILAENMVKALAEIDVGRDAGLVVRTRALEMNHVRRAGGVLRGDIEFGLYGANGRVVFATPGVGRIAPSTYWVAEAREGPWRLVLAEPRLADVTMIGWLGRSAFNYLLIAFPIAMLPLWVAVQRGMRPLRSLADAVARREAHDLSPLSFTPRHDELIPLTTAFDGLLAALRSRQERERAFVQDAAHELRTPMAVVATQAHLMATADDARQREHAHIALDQALQRAAHLSRQLLSLATLDEASGGNPQLLDLTRIVEQTLAQLAPLALERGLELSLEAPASLSAVLDPVALDSLLLNLVDNALRYVQRGGTVAVTLAVQATHTELRVADDGPGIPAEQREAAFERFWRGPSGGDQTGSGLGLAIVRRAAARLGGHVHVEDGLKQRGCTFVLRLPGVG